MKTYEERTANILQKTKEKKARRRIITHSSVTAGVLAAVTALNLFLFLPFQTEEQALRAHKGSEYYAVMSAIHDVSKTQNENKPKNNFEKYVEGFFEQFAFGCGGADKNGGAMAPEGNGDGTLDGDLALPAPGESADPNGGYVETTDNQVAGVIEGDLFKRTTTHIFYLDTSAAEIRAYSIAQENSECVGSISVKKEWQRGEMQMYLSADGDTLTLVQEVGVRPSGKTFAEHFTCVSGYDVSDPTAMKTLGESYLTGQFISARMTGNELLLFNNFYVASNYDFDEPRTFLPHYGDLDDLQPIAGKDIVCPEGGMEKRYTVACAIDLESMEVSACTALFSYSTGVYVSAENIFLSREYRQKDDNVQRDKTEISRIDYSGDGLEFKGSFTVDGTLKNQYSMDEYEGILRVVTTNRTVTTFYNGRRSQVDTAGSLYCVDLSTSQTVASVENFIRGETVESVRFDKEKVSVCTAVVVTFTDPVFVFDLSDLNNITYVDTGVIAGYSTSLVQFVDGYWLGIGYDGNRMLKIELYEETATGVESVCAYRMNAEFSEEYKSYYIDREEGLIGLCVYDYDGGEAQYILLGFDGYEWVEVCSVDGVAMKSNLQKTLSTARATVIDGYLYVIVQKAGDAEGFYVKKL